MLNDIALFREIRSAIQKNPENFKPAGKWLDGLFPNNPDFIRPMAEAFTKAVCEYPPNREKVMLITWLVTDKYLHESKLGITKYEQYAFRHDVIRPESNIITEQEFAKDAVFAKHDAMEEIQNAYLSYKGSLPEESGGKAKVATTKKRYRKWVIPVVVAFIGAVATILVPFINWLLNSHNNKQSISLQKNVSTSLNAETKGNLSPAVVNSPNSTFNMNTYIIPRQSDFNSENKETDTNRPK